MTPVEEYCIEQPKHIQSILKKLRFLILSTAPQLEERIVYGIPFFYMKRESFTSGQQNPELIWGFVRGIYFQIILF